MPDLAKINRALSYLREEIPAEDISKNPVFKHPHNTTRLIPERLPPAKIRELSRLRPAKAIATTLGKWALIAAAIAICATFWHPALYVFAVAIIGSCQHALLILGHDASHFRTLSVRWQNDLFANLFMMWPTFASVEGFRKFHGGNRHIWYTHDAAGELAPDWQFPKTRLGLAWLLLRRAAFFTGLFWILRGLVGATLIPSPGWMRAARLGFYGFGATALTYFDIWLSFLLYWIVPFCTWHIAVQYIRLICEHSAVESDQEEYAITRTTIPTWLESVFILPCNVGHHLEHHWYPSVPFYHLPQLHQALMERQSFRAHAVIGRSVFASLGECVREARALSSPPNRDRQPATLG
jgi:fatty acid desaturase